MMEKRNWLMTLGALAIVVSMFSGSALAYLEVNHSYHWENESDRSQGNGYSINLEIWNHWDYPIEINNVGIHMDWQQPGEYDYDMNTAWLDPETSYGATFFIYIPVDAYIGDHNYNIQIEYRAYQVDITTDESWPVEGWDFFVEPANGGGDDGDDGDGDDGSEGIFGNGGMSIDWESIDAGIPASVLSLLFVALFIGIIVVMPVVYFLTKD